MPEPDAQKKELEQAEETQQLTAQNGATGDTSTAPEPDAQKKEIQEV